MAGEFQIEGLGDVLTRMRQLSPKLQQKGARTAVRKGAAIVRKAAQENAKRIDDPATARSIAKNIAMQFASRSSRQIGGVMFRVGVRGGAKNPETKSVRQQGSGKVAKANRGGDTWYWRLVELGTSKMRAQPFMVPALANNVEKVTATITTELNVEIDKLIASGVR